jgi:cell division protein FtsI/penicillin-binding protein 2
LARVDFEELAAKTGTAQAPPHEPHAWMTGFFPYHDPQIAFVVMVEHGGSGGITAARIVKQALQIWKELYAPAGMK